MTEPEASQARQPENRSAAQPTGQDTTQSTASPTATPEHDPGSANILLIDDDAKLTRLLRESLESVGYAVTEAHNGLDGLRELYARQPDLLVLDVMMPRMDGWQTLERVREMSNVPVIMLTARDAEPERLRGFELGADDYVTKPFSLAEINARVKAVLARSGRGSLQVPSLPSLTVGEMEIDFRDRVITRRGEVIHLTPTEYRLLATLAESHGHTLSHEQLLERVWGPEYVDEPGYVKRYVWYLRQKIEDDPSVPRYVETVRGFGYRLAKD